VAISFGLWSVVTEEHIEVVVMADSDGDGRPWVVAGHGGVGVDCVGCKGRSELSGVKEEKQNGASPP
jgi:hypothetical protein